MASDDRRYTSLTNRLKETSEQLKQFKRRTLARIEDASDPVGNAATDVAGGVLSLGTKAGIEIITDKARKVVTPVGQFRAPSVVSGGVATGVGVAGYLFSFLDEGFPSPWYIRVPRASGFGLVVLGLKEVGQAAAVWNEQRQLRAQNEAAVFMLAQQQAALAQAQANANAKKA